MKIGKKILFTFLIIATNFKFLINISMLTRVKTVFILFKKKKIADM